AADLNLAQLQALRNNPRILRIEEDGIASISATQSGATWGIDRIDQRSLPLNGNFTYTKNGQNVLAYIVDTGVLGSHNEFTGRMSDSGYTAIADGGGTVDCNGHGTHVAGTVAGSTFGVAKNATIVPVRVLDCGGSGSWSGVVAGLQWIVDNHPLGALGVVNMSLGGGANSSVDDAVTSVVLKGINVVVAAGNSTANACNSSPARAPLAITVAASTSTDSLASYSNFGSCVDIIAPGTSITSAWYTGNNATATLQGTSMASPHVAGAMALILEGNSLSTADATNILLSRATLNRVSLSTRAINAATPNRLLFSGENFMVRFLDIDGTSVLAQSQSVIQGSAITLPSATKSGFTFDGWWTATSGGTKIGNAGASYTPTSSINLFGRWIADSLPSSPLNVQLSSPTARTITVTWLAPLQQGSGIIRYEARAFSKSKGGSTLARCVTANGSTLTCSLTNLTSGFRYFVDVVAINLMGTGPASTPRAYLVAR
ncbi:MAG: S8 family serine peptidase, partial [Candidatus Nanopelagicaceae bacterium]